MRAESLGRSNENRGDLRLAAVLAWALPSSWLAIAVANTEQVTTGAAVVMMVMGAALCWPRLSAGPAGSRLVRHGLAALTIMFFYEVARGCEVSFSLGGGARFVALPAPVLLGAGVLARLITRRIPQRRVGRRLATAMTLLTLMLLAVASSVFFVLRGFHSIDPLPVATDMAQRIAELILLLVFALHCVPHIARSRRATQLLGVLSLAGAVAIRIRP